MTPSNPTQPATTQTRPGLHATLATLLALTAAAICAPAAAHVVLQDRSAVAGSAYRAVLLVTHGCEGSPVTGVTVRIPAGMQGAKPMPKPGWALSITKQPLAQPYTSHGKPVTEDVTELRWTATGREAWLPDGAFDEFILRGQLPATPGPLWFKVLQTCEKGSIDWAEIPTEGTSTKGLKAPAALLDVQPNPHAGHMHMH